MASRILLLSDIHANYPALAAVEEKVAGKHFDMILNGGDSVVYAPFPNETINWLRNHKAVSILGNTDIKTLQLLAGKELKKPRKEDKRVMYTWTAGQLTGKNRKFLKDIPQKKIFDLEGYRIGMFHGSPADDTEHLFDTTPKKRFRELAGATDCDIVLVGHSHTPFHKKVNGVHFINPGSVGRMFDGDPAASFGILKLGPAKLNVKFSRCPYNVDEVVNELRTRNLPPIYEEMYRRGMKLN